MPGEKYPIEAASSPAKAGGSKTVGQLHNEVLTEFHTTFSIEETDYEDAQDFVDVMFDATDEAFLGALGVDEKSFMEQEISSVLLGMHDYGAMDVFGPEILDAELIGSYFESNGWLTQYQADWLTGYIEAIENCDSAAEAQIAINLYTFNNGLPVPKTPLFYFYETTVYSLLYWEGAASSSSKWGFPWKEAIIGASDGLCALAGGVIAGGASAGIGAGVGAVIGGTLGSGAVHMMMDYYDENF